MEVIIIGTIIFFVFHLLFRITDRKTTETLYPSKGMDQCREKTAREKLEDYYAQLELDGIEFDNWRKISRSHMPKKRVTSEELFEIMGDPTFLVCPCNLSSGLRGLHHGCKIYLKND